MLKSNQLIRKLGSFELLLYKIDLNIVVLITLNTGLDLSLLQKSVNHAEKIHKMSNVTIVNINDIYHFSKPSAPIKINKIALLKDDLNFFIDGELNYIYQPGESLFRLHHLSIDNERFLLFNFNHVVSDGRSVIKYISDLFSIYNDSCQQEIQECTFPDCIESYFSQHLLPAETKMIDVISNKNLMYKKRKSLTIENCNNSKQRIFSTLNQFNTKSISSVLSSLALKQLWTIVKKQDLTCYLNVDLRTVFKLEPCRLSFYSIGISEQIHNVGETTVFDMVNKLQTDFYTRTHDSGFIKKALTQVFCQSDAIAISYIKGSTLDELEKCSFIQNINFYGNCMYFPKDENKIFIIFTKFRDNINFSLNYDIRSFSNENAEIYFRGIVSDIHDYFI